MSRYFYIGFLIILGAALLFTYGMLPSSSTSPTTGLPSWDDLLKGSSELSAQTASTAEFGGVSLRLEYATTSAAREFGLGGRENIAPDQAMLFVFKEDDYYGFWMNDMLVPIDIFWLDDKGQVVSIQNNVAASSYPDVFYPTAPARYVLETAAGFAQAHSVATGTPLLLKNFPTVTE